SLDAVQRDPPVPLPPRPPQGLRAAAGRLHRRREAEGAGGGGGRRAGHQGGPVQPCRPQGQRAGPGCPPGAALQCFFSPSQLSSRSKASSRSSEDKLVWSGWFCSVFGDDLSENVPEQFTCLPLFLTHGAESYTSLVGSWFQKTFDCCFRRLAISPLNLSWMVAMWAGCKLDRAASAVELIFSVPRLSQPLDISYAIHPEDAKALWDTVQKTPGEITQEEVDVFMDCLYAHFHRHFKIHLSAAKLVKVSTAIASAHCDGIVKILHSQYLPGVLMLLTELAISQIQ
ncbi:centromere protein L, partial [Vidua chalybeata]|uniref:centromere protein L n=1 Tax=Vidua chalybeata TaxID=81927 RepID=UPI0023A790F5